MDGAKVFLVGAGPGDPELLTLKALRLLARADAVLYDSLVGEEILALVNPGAELIDTGKRCGRHSMTQADISELLVRTALRGGVVVRLKGGDPLLFGRAAEEMAALQAHGIEFEIIPGITTALAAAASLRQSLTLRGVSRGVHFVAGHTAEGDIPAHDFTALAKAGGTIAIYMGGNTLAGLAAHLIEAGTDPALPAVAIENVSLPDERVVRGTLASLPRRLEAARPAGPVLILAGQALTAAAPARSFVESLCLGETRGR